MSVVRRVSLGPRLAVAFVFCIAALVAVAALGFTSMRSIQDRGERLFERDALAMDATGRLSTLLQENGHDTAQHLYVYDGDLATQDKLAAELKADGRELTKLVATLDRTAPDGIDVSSFAAATSSIIAVRNEAITASRAETVSGVDDRDGSRAIYVEQLLPQLDAFRRRADALTAQLETHARGGLAENETNARSATITVAVVTALAAIGALFAAIVVTRSISRPVERLRRTADALSTGDIAEAAAIADEATRADLAANDEVARTEQAFAELVDYLDTTSDVAMRIAEGDTTVDIEMHSDGDLLGEAMLRMRDSASDMARVAGRIAAGDLGVEAPVRGDRDELGTAFGRMIEDLRQREADQLARQRIDESRAAQAQALLDDLAAMSEQLSGASSTSERAAAEVTSGMEEIAGSMAEMAANAQQQVGVLRAASTSARGAADAARATTQVVDGGVASVDRASAAMATLNDSAQHVSDAITELSAKSERVGGIVATITSIAEQTNLLALNAAIEAARAGDQGRGFAVVADEVRKLASGSQESAGQIAAIVAEIRTETERTVEAVAQSLANAGEGGRTVDEARAAFLEIEQSVRGVLGQADEIHASTERAVELAQEASSHTEQVSAATEQTAASMQEVSATASELSRLADSLSRTAAGDDAAAAGQPLRPGLQAA